MNAADSNLRERILSVIREAREKWDDSLGRQKFRDALDRVLTLARHGNRLFDQAEPWKSRKEDLDRCGADLAALLEVVHAIGVC